MNTEKRYFQIEANLPIGYPEENLRYSIHDEYGNEDFSSSMTDITDNIFDAEWFSDISFKNEIRPNVQSVINTFYTQRIYFEDGEVMHENEEELNGTCTAIYMRLKDGTNRHIKDFQCNDDANSFCKFLNLIVKHSRTY